MAKTHEFTENATSMPVSIVIDKIVSYKHDGFSECTKINLVGGASISVSESIKTVKAVIDDA